MTGLDIFITAVVILAVGYGIYNISKNKRRERNEPAPPMSDPLPPEREEENGNGIPR